MTSIETELMGREREWMDAVARKDLAALDRIVGEDYVYTASGQGRWSRQRWMDAVAIYDLERFAFLEVDVRAYGDVAVVLSRYEQEAAIAGNPRGGEFLLTDVWVRRDGAWRVVARSSILMPALAQAPQAAHSEQDANKAVVRRLFAEVFNGGDLDAITTLVAPDVLGHDATGSAPKRGLASVRQVAVLFRTAFPDLRLDLEDLISDGETVTARWSLRGTHRGEFMGVAATGREATTAGIVIYRLAEGKIAEYWGSFDALSLMRQLGAVPTRAEQPSQ